MAYGIRWNTCEDTDYVCEFLGDKYRKTPVDSRFYDTLDEAKEAMAYHRKHGEFPTTGREYPAGIKVPPTPEHGHHHKIDAVRETGRRFVIEGETVTTRTVADGDRLAEVLDADYSS